MRQISGLHWAKRAVAAPWPKSHPRGVKAQGLRFERLVARLLVGVEHNPWFEFEDDNGHGFCSPDLLLVGTKRTLVLECKLSDGAQGWMQVSGLYAPVLRGVFGMEVVPVVVTRTLRRGSVVAHSLREAVERAAERPVLHYIGHGPFPLD